MTSDTLWRQNYELFVARYRHRQDSIGLLRPDRSRSILPGGLTYKRFRQHMNERCTYAIYNLDDSGRVGFILFDMDVFPRTQRPWVQWLQALRAKKRQVQVLIDALNELNIAGDQVLVEFPTVGFHVLLFLEEPLPATDAKAFARLARDRAGLRFETPFYPRDNYGRGDLVLLPLRRNVLTGKRSNFIRDILSFDPANYDEAPDFLPLEQVRAVAPQTILAVVDALTRPAYLKVATVQEIPAGITKLVESEGRRLLLINQGGKFLALSELCPHAGGPLSQGCLSEGHIECPWHGARFRIEDGEVVAGPARMGLTRYPVMLKGDEVWVGPALD